MRIVIGYIGCIACILIGLIGPGGPPGILIQPFEYIVIVGCGLCTLVISCPSWVLKALVPSIMHAAKGTGISVDTYKDVLGLMASVFDTMRREGVLGIEGDLNNPHESARFNRYPKASGNHHMMETFTGALRLFVDGVVNAFDLERLLDAELETHHEEAMIVPTTVNKLGDAFPALGIVAAVLGIIVTMQYLDGPPAEIGHHVAAALVGTMLGIALCYGFVGPVATLMEHCANEEFALLKVVKAGLVSFAGGAPPQVALEFARKSIPPIFRPTAADMEQIMKDAKK